MGPLVSNNSAENKQIFDELNQWGTKGHEEIKLEKIDSSHYKLVTTKETPWLFRWIRSLFGQETKVKVEVATFLVNFFEKLSDDCLKQQDLPLIEKEIKLLKYYKNYVPKEKEIYQRIDQLLKNKLTPTKRHKRNTEEGDQIIQEVASRARSLVEASQKELEEKRKESENEIQFQTEQLLQIRQQELKNLDGRVESLKNTLISLKKEKDDSIDMMLICRDEFVEFAHSKHIESIPYFKTYLARSDLKRLPIPDSSKKTYPNLEYCLSFPDYDLKTIQQFIKFQASKQLDPSLNDDELLELYQFADFVRDDVLIKVCANQLTSRLSPSRICQLLSELTYNSNAPLIQKLIEKTALNFEKIMNLPQFVNMQPEYLIKLVARDDIKVKGESILFEHILVWAQSQAEAENEIVQTILYRPMANGDRLIDQIRFEHLSSEKIRQLCTSSTSPLSIEDRLRWQTFHFVDSASIQELRPCRSYFSVNPTSQKQCEVTWRIPLLKKELKDKEKQALSPNFEFAGKTWYLSFAYPSAPSTDILNKKYIGCYCLEGGVEKDFNLKIQLSHLNYNSQLPGESRPKAYGQVPKSNTMAYNVYYSFEELETHLKTDQDFLITCFITLKR